MAEESNARPSESAHFTAAEAEADDELKGLVAAGTDPGSLKFVIQNLRVACQRARRREANDSENADPPTHTDASAFPASVAGSASSELEAALAASTASVGDTELVSTDTWWAQRWIDKATPGELAAMRELLL